MVKKSIYKLGDIFKIPLGDDVYGIGRILIIQSPAMFVGFYQQMIKTNDEIDINALNNQEYTLSIKCGDVGFKKKEWEVIGNIPLKNKVTLPFFWGDDPLTNQLYLREYITTDDDPLGLGSAFKDRSTTEKEIAEKQAAPDGLSGWKAAEIKLKMHLDKIKSKLH